MGCKIFRKEKSQKLINNDFNLQQPNPAAVNTSSSHINRNSINVYENMDKNSGSAVNFFETSNESLQSNS